MDSVYTAELLDIFTCLSNLAQFPPNGKFFLLTDSLSSLHSLSLLDLYTSSPLLQRIHLTRSTLNEHLRHIHLDYRSYVDRAAEQTTFVVRITDNTYLSVPDHKTYYLKLILHTWNTHRKNQPSNKLLPIEQTPLPWISTIRNFRRGEVILTRLQISHTRIIHSHFIKQDTLFPHLASIVANKTFEFTWHQLLPLRSLLNVTSSLNKALRNNSDTNSLVLQHLAHTAFPCLHEIPHHINSFHLSLF